MLRIFILVFFVYIKESLSFTCPDCSKIKCPDLDQEDCPSGTVLTEKMYFGCCPACVRYLQSGEACPGPLISNAERDEDGNSFCQNGLPPNGQFCYDMTWGPDAIDHYQSFDQIQNFPDKFIEETIELPCSLMEIIDDGIGDPSASLFLPERIFSAEWQTSPRNKMQQVPVISSARCAPNLRCYNDITEIDYTLDYMTCLRPFDLDNWEAPGFTSFPCTLTEIDFRKSVELDDCTVRQWEPNCKQFEGVFDAVQRKSFDADYWCSDPFGNMIFGKEKTTFDDVTINCKCSRKIWELKQEKGEPGDDFYIPKRFDVSLHCEMNGNYELLQCDDGVCWCMDQNTAKPVSKVVPESLVKWLPCYERMVITGREKFGSKYNRKCESRKLGILNTTRILQERGTRWDTTNVDCDPTGGFAKKYCDSSMCYCVSKEMTRGKYSFGNVNVPASSCNCARDFLDGLTSSDICDGFGNYFSTPRTQDTEERGSLEYCVDQQDNWRISGKVPSQEQSELPCCLDSHFYTASDYHSQDWLTIDEEHRHKFSCRKFQATGPDDNGKPVGTCKDCSDDIKDCKLADTTY